MITMHALLGNVVYFLLFRLKTGNVPPDDLPFEETPIKTKEKGGTIGRKKSEQKKDAKLFPKKQEIEDKIAFIESDIEKGKTTHINLYFNKSFSFRSY